MGAVAIIHPIPHYDTHIYYIYIYNVFRITLFSQFFFKYLKMALIYILCLHQKKKTNFLPFKELRCNE